MRHKIIFILLITELVCSFENCLLFAQVSQDWAARYHFISDDWANDIALDTEGNVYVTGRSKAANGYTDYATVKYNSSGVQQWVMRYNGPGNNLDEATSIAVSNSGSVYTTGFSRSGPDANYNDFATVKYSTAGVEQWVRRYDAGGSDVAYKVAIDGNGNILVGGWSTQPRGPDFAVIKYDTNGNVLWVRTYDSGPPDNQYDYAVAMAVDRFNNVYLTGSVGANIAPAPDWATVKWNTQGVFQWARRYDGPGNGVDYAKAITVSDSGNVYVTGYVWRNNHSECAVIKYNPTGIQQWVVFTGYPSAGMGISADDTENVYVAIASNTYTTIKYNSTGIQQWSSNLLSSSAQPRCIKLDDSGNVYVTGYATVATNNTDYCTVKYNNSGAQQWVMYYSGIGGQGNPYDEAKGLAIDQAGNVYVTGSSGRPGNQDYVTIKYSQTTGITKISNEIPKEYKLEQNYPNPFNPTTHFEFRIPARSAGGADYGFVSLKIFDVSGKEIQTLVNEQLKPGIYEVDFDGSMYSSGIYYYTLSVLQTGSSTGDFKETKKMVLIK